jgi:transcriptional regulator with XRE-family HTH domain
MDKRGLRRERVVLRALLRETRQAAGLRQTDVAERLGVPQSFVAKVEGGERRLDVVELRRLCFVLGVAFTVFVERLDQRLTEETEPTG